MSHTNYELMPERFGRKLEYSDLRHRNSDPILECSDSQEDCSDFGERRFEQKSFEKNQFEQDNFGQNNSEENTPRSPE
jgi:hypothetical protein